ncbi:MAG: adenylate/guanylate cyclase domain-containing protein [Actinomycetota bacterium]
MADTPRWRRFLEPVLSIGSYHGEPETKRGGRRVVVVAFIVATVVNTPSAFADLAAGYTWVAAMNFVTIALAPLLVVAIRLRPHDFAALVTAMFVVIFATLLVETSMFGGLLASGLVVIFSLVFVLGSLVAIGLKAAAWWFAAFVASVVYAVVIPNWMDPIYELSDPTGDAALNLIATGIITLAALAYFVRQRDRFQERADDLLHNILPDEIVARLKDGSTMIADDVASASVLFADIVDFTPMSAGMSPAELVGLLDDVFTRFDGFVAELGLEKIKTVGDEYMVAAGVPRARDDHAHAIADLALRIRDHVATNLVKGHRLSLRIGINSGSLTAGIIGTHKFSYDLWGDTVNTASRMESEGVAGSIQLSSATYALIRDEYVCEARGIIRVKGKGEMETYLLISKRDETDDVM